MSSNIQESQQGEPACNVPCCNKHVGHREDPAKRLYACIPGNTTNRRRRVQTRLSTELDFSPESELWKKMNDKPYRDPKPLQWIEWRTCRFLSSFQQPWIARKETDWNCEGFRHTKSVSMRSIMCILSQLPYDGHMTNE